jgi:hypothetical protein|tara:strand:- start:168 stop:836 length:669 start_codon:yes stop_codon:yes gene_type:complete
VRETLIIKGKALDNARFCTLVDALTKKKYRPIIDPRNFDNPITTKARFKTKEEKIRFIEISPNLEIEIEHTGNKTEGKTFLNEIKINVETSIPAAIIKPEDFELATLQMIARKESVIIPKNSSERKLFMSLVEKNIFTLAKRIECPHCNISFMFPKEKTVLGTKSFCKDCEKWFEIKRDTEAFVLNEDYMEVLGGMWGKMQKLIKDSWREVVKKGVPMIPKV